MRRRPLELWVGASAAAMGCTEAAGPLGPIDLGAEPADATSSDTGDTDGGRVDLGPTPDCSALAQLSASSGLELAPSPRTPECRPDGRCWVASSGVVRRGCVAYVGQLELAQLGPRNWSYRHDVLVCHECAEPRYLGVWDIREPVGNTRVRSDRPATVEYSGPFVTISLVDQEGRGMPQGCGGGPFASIFTLLPVELPAGEVLMLTYFLEEDADRGVPWHDGDASRAYDELPDYWADPIDYQGITQLRMSFPNLYAQTDDIAPVRALPRACARAGFPPLPGSVHGPVLAAPPPAASEPDNVVHTLPVTLPQTLIDQLLTARPGR